MATTTLRELIEENLPSEPTAINAAGLREVFIEAADAIDAGGGGGGGSSTWGGITGTLSAQTDLAAALALKAPLASPTFTGTVSGITKANVGLSNVDNTTDAGKPVSTAQAAADAAVQAYAIQRGNHTGTQPLSTLAQSGAANGQVVKWNGSAWAAADDSGGGGGGATNLSTTAAPTSVTINSDTGTDAVIAATDGTNAGLLLPAEKTKLAGIATAATANDTDANLKARANHTGTQAATTITEDSTHRFATDAEKTTWNAYQRVYNVVSYGALPNATNTSGNRITNTAAFNAAITAALAAGCGQVYVPNGKYYVNQIAIQGVALDSATDGIGYRSMEIVGEATPSQLFGTVGSVLLSPKGAIIECPSTTIGEAIIKVLPFAGDFSGIQLVLKNLELRSYDNPIISGVNAGWAAQFRMHDCQVSTGVYSVLASNPTTNTATAVVTPFINNGALNILENVSISGYFTGIEVNEHTYASYLNVTACGNAAVVRAANHASHIVRLCVQDCMYGIVFDGLHFIDVDQYNLEYAASGWQQMAAAIYDPSNYGRGTIKWAAVAAGSGPSNVFVRTGGAYVVVGKVGRNPVMSVTTTQMNAYASPTAGMQVFVTDASPTPTVYLYNGTSWVAL